MLSWVNALAGSECAAIEDDDSVELRFPNIEWSENPAVRKAQRKCLLISEWYEKNPKVTAAIEKADADKLRRYIDQKIAPYTPGRAEVVRQGQRPTQFHDEGWQGIEATAPAPWKAKVAS